ncbi:MAG: glycosyltransferase [Pseudomonadota bacterium]
MNIGIVIGGNQRGGAERQVSLLAQGLLNKGFLVVVFFMSHPYYFGGKHDFGKVKCIHLYNTRYTKHVSLPYFRYLLKKYDISHLHTFILESIEYGIEALTGSHIKHIGSERSIFFAENPSLAVRLREACKGVSMITCNCRAMQELMVTLDITSHEKTRVVNNGIVLGREAKLSCNKNNKDAFNILFVGTLKDIKDPLSFVKAAFRVLETQGNFKFTIAGDGPLRGAIENLLKNSRFADSFTLLGSLPNEHIPYAMANLLISTSTTEASSNSILEALSEGVPVIGTAVGGTKELLVGNSFGRLVEPGDIEGIANAIEEFHNKPDYEIMNISKKAKEFISNNYSVEQMVNEYIKLYGAA